MNKLSISIFGNKIFIEIINELKLFSKFKIEYYEDLNLCIRDAIDKARLVIFFITELNKKNYKEINKNNFPSIIIARSSVLKNILPGELVEQLNMPFSILDLEKKIISLFAKYEFKKSSVINLQNVSHTIKKCWWDGDDVMGDVEILPTPAGNIL